jgi:hypothetical protein
MSAHFYMVKLLLEKRSMLAEANEAKAEAVLRAWNQDRKQKQRKLYTNGNSFPKKAALAIRAARIIDDETFNAWGELLNKPIAKWLRGESRTAEELDAAIMAVVLYGTDTSRAALEKQALEQQLTSVFYSNTACDCGRCKALLQIAILFKVLYTPPRTSPAAPVCTELAAEGGAMHHATAMPLAAVLLYIQAVEESGGTAFSEVSKW